MNHLDDWLRAAYAAEEAGCPPPEAYLQEEMDGLSESDRRRLEEHAESCPACAAERELARSFDTAGATSLDVSEEDLAFVVSHLKDASPGAAPKAKVVPFRVPTAKPSEFPARRRTDLWKIAAVLVLVLGAGLLFQLSRSGAPPLLPPPSQETVLRGGEIEGLSPAGDVQDIPGELRWEPRPGTVTYRVRLLSVDDAVLWEATVPAPPARLPESVAAGLHRAVSYSWTVEALDGSGRRLASSEPVRFRARPSPEGTEPL